MGITLVDRRDLERLLKHLVHEAQRDDVRVDIKYYVQFELLGAKDGFTAQTLVDPWQSLSRSDARALVKAAIERLDDEEKKNEERKKAESFIAQISVPPIEAATADPNPVVLNAETGVYTAAEASSGDGNIGELTS